MDAQHGVLQLLVDCDILYDAICCLTGLVLIQQHLPFTAQVMQPFVFDFF